MNAILSPVALSRLPFPPPFLRQLTFEDWIPSVLAPAPKVREPRSELMRELLRILRRCARSGAPVPPNPILAIQTSSVRQSTARAVRVMEREGFFRIEVKTQRRRIVFPDGLATDWGDFREGHAPGPRRTEPRKPVRAPNSPPMAPTVKPMPVDVRRAPEACQYPTWDDSERPRAGAVDRVCGAAALRGESWCLEHLAIVSPGRARRKAALLASTSLCCS